MTENPLGFEKISKLLKDFAIPSIMASLVGSIYNIVDRQTRRPRAAPEAAGRRNERARNRT